ncbi:FxDxF family PEP-CTERM protein [Telluria mixta]|uniref:FxDxF family PEP-CTERM protein n=1 Tax=Telluria mixta TaxID=34071 RepID=A0ABT2BT42_9BURK|nr:FxDxF family PEP-CTERM protein [Telluria mixta]MCS0628284.1 FxDxF family PEP-CTERM protein [Telluria mixta]WEM93604.1 FxDxF family PEP-CTERM protein [Telluria mixta]
MTSRIRTTLLAALLGAGALASAQAGTIEFQGVDFTSSWSGNVLTLEVDAAAPTGSWAGATSLGALQLKDLGSFDSVSLTAAPGGAANWTLSSKELNANGCTGGSHAGSSLCYSGARLALTDDMVFQFTFSGDNVDPTSPQLKLTMFGADGNKKVGSLMGEHLVVSAVPEPQTYALMLGGLGLLGVMARRKRA